MRACRCSPGWTGHRCESVTSGEGSTSSGGRKWTLKIQHQLQPATSIVMPQSAYFVCRHSLHRDPCAAPAPAGSAGCRSVDLVQEKDEWVSRSQKASLFERGLFFFKLPQSFLSPTL